MPSIPICPHCKDEKVSRWDFANGLQRYRCSACRATFNALTDTPLAGIAEADETYFLASQKGKRQGRAQAPVNGVIKPANVEPRKNDRCADLLRTASHPPNSSKQLWVWLEFNMLRLRSYLLPQWRLEYMTLKADEEQPGAPG